MAAQAPAIGNQEPLANHYKMASFCHDFLHGSSDGRA
jgi:hypothetical protein